jgi:hypothetical protein
MPSFSDLVRAPKTVPVAAPAPVVEQPADNDDGAVTVAALDAAIQRFNARVVAAHAAGRADFRAEKNIDACASLAAALRRYRSLTEKQTSYARALIGWSQDQQPAVAPAGRPAPVARPKTWAALQPFAKLHAGRLSFAKKNGEPLWWVLFDDALVGKAEDETVISFGQKVRAAGLDAADILAALDEFERDPAAALKAHGIATGSCGCCGRELTDPQSIERGIGPICWERGGF